MPLFYPYLEVDRLTKKYGEEFSELYRDNGFYSDIEYLKVIKYKEESAHFLISNKKISDEIDELINSDALVLYIEEGPIPVVQMISFGLIILKGGTMKGESIINESQAAKLQE